MAYFNDWFGRSAEHGYTHYSSTNRTVGWDRGYDNFSDYFFSGRPTSSARSSLMTNAATLLSTMSKVMGISSSKFKAGSHQLKSSEAVIPTDMLKDSKISTDIFLGAALQSIAHTVHKTGEEFDYDRRTSKGKMNVTKTVYHTLNAERVNNLMAEDTPGYLKFVQKYKTHAYTTARPEVPKDNDGAHLLDLFDRIIRYPENITEEELEKFAEPIDEIKKYITKSGGIPADHGDCVKLSKKISNIISKYIKEEESSDDDKKDDSESKEGSGEGEGEAKSEPTKADQLEKYMKELVDSMKPKDNADGSTYKAFMEEMSEAEDRGSLKCDVKAEFLVVPESYNSIVNYERLHKKIDHTKSHVISTLLKRKNRDYQFVMKSMKSGRLDTSKLAEAKQHVSTIYERIGEVKTNKLCVAVLVDESGSMGGSKADGAGAAAIFLREALIKVPDVELFIYGHTADLPSSWHDTRDLKYKGGSGTTQVFVYQEPGMKISKNLGFISGKYENRDGTAIISVAKRVRSKTQNRGVLVVISDGSPSANNYGGETARKDVQKRALQAEQLGFEVIQVTIGGYRSTDMFRTVVDIDDVRQFPEKFVALLKKKVNTMIKETVKL
jgi:hypothetical protein